MCGIHPEQKPNFHLFMMTREIAIDFWSGQEEIDIFEGISFRQSVGWTESRSLKTRADGL